MRKDELRSRDVEFLLQMEEKPREAVSYYQKHLDAIDTKMWNSILFSIGYLAIIVALLPILVFLDEETRHIYICSVAIVVTFVSSFASILIILWIVSTPRWFSFSNLPGNSENQVIEYCCSMARLRDDRSGLLRIAFVLNLFALFSMVAFVTWWALLKLERPACPPWFFSTFPF